VIRPGDEVLVIATVVTVLDASQTLDMTVRVGSSGSVAYVTDADLIHKDGEILVRGREPGS
jgi:hypothetical protein